MFLKMNFFSMKTILSLFLVCNAVMHAFSQNQYYFVPPQCFEQGEMPVVRGFYDVFVNTMNKSDKRFYQFFEMRVVNPAPHGLFSKAVYFVFGCVYYNRNGYGSPFFT